MYNTIEIYWNGNESKLNISEKNIENIKYSINKIQTMTDFKTKNIVEIILKLDENIESVQEELKNWGLCKSKDVYNFYRNIKIIEIINEVQYRFVSFYYLGIKKFEQKEKDKQLILTLRQREDKLSFIGINEEKDKILDDKYTQAYQSYILSKIKNDEILEEDAYEFYTNDKLDYSGVNLSEDEIKKYLEKGYFFNKTV
ncbi:hypothetical protein [uncultured Tyzzerella sp.]|uniref:hypothetical protein n=1 Tax=uncultured Tyzzerella sp. TaxID=2321398 RepID=UPI00294203BB|nr:hypothetical protein [uncultured Tyzzerella sp.]